MRSLRSLINVSRQPALWFALGGAVAIVGLAIGANFERQGFFDVKLHELLSGIGSSGALLIMAAVMWREKRWRTSDKSAQAVATWSVISGQVIQMSVALEMTLSYLDKVEADPEDFDPEGLHDCVKRMAAGRVAFEGQIGRISQLPPGMSESLGYAVGKFETWEMAVTSLTTQEPDEAAWEHVFPWAKSQTESMLADFNQCIKLSGRSAHELWG